MIDEIIGKIREGLYEYSQHAVDQSIVRMISTKEVKEAIENGKVIEDIQTINMAQVACFRGLPKMVSLYILCVRRHRQC